MTPKVQQTPSLDIILFRLPQSTQWTILRLTRHIDGRQLDQEGRIKLLQLFGSLLVSPDESVISADEVCGELWSEIMTILRTFKESSSEREKDPTQDVIIGVMRTLIERIGLVQLGHAASSEKMSQF